MGTHLCSPLNPHINRCRSEAWSARSEAKSSDPEWAGSCGLSALKSGGIWGHLGARIATQLMGN